MHLEVITQEAVQQVRRGVRAAGSQDPLPRDHPQDCSTCEGRHKKQTGGHGQFGHVVDRVLPRTRTAATKCAFVDAIVGGVVPRELHPRGGKGPARKRADRACSPGIRWWASPRSCTDRFLPCRSTPLKWRSRSAARLAFKKGCIDASPVLLEPIYHVEVLVPDEYMGDIIGDMNKRRGRIIGMNPGRRHAAGHRRGAAIAKCSSTRPICAP